jgi:hypothetical protein
VLIKIHNEKRQLCGSFSLTFLFALLLFRWLWEKFFNNSGIILKSLRNYCKVETFSPTFFFLHKFQLDFEAMRKLRKGWKIKFMIANLSENARLESISGRNSEHKFAFALHKPIKYLFMQNEVEFLQSSHTHRGKWQNANEKRTITANSTLRPTHSMCV